MKKLLAIIVFLGVLLTVEKAMANSPSKNFEKVTINKKEGTATLVNPAYYEEAWSINLGISEHSDMNGVCLHFGFGDNIEVSTVGSDDEQMAVIDETGEVSGYYGNENPEKNRKITSIICTLKRSQNKK